MIKTKLLSLLLMLELLFTMSQRDVGKQNVKITPSKVPSLRGSPNGTLAYAAYMRAVR